MVTFVRVLLLIGEAERDDRHRSGRLDDGGDRIERNLATGRYITMGLGRHLLPAPRARRGSPPKVVPLHLRVSAVSKRPPAGKDGLTARDTAARKGRVYVRPKRGKTRELKAAGGSYDRKVRSWYVPDAQFAAVSMAMGPSLQRHDGGARRCSRGRVQGGAAAAFQRYIERADATAEERLAELAVDSAGEPISFGTFGEDADERAAFWESVEARERIDGCVQNRAIIALPYELDSAELAALVRDLMAPLAERGLPHHAAVHRPDVAAGSDPRNVHLHALWSERPAQRTSPHSWSFAPRKDRSARGPKWVRELRERSAATINRHLDVADMRRRAEGQPGIERRFDARSYADRGVAMLPGVHLGPRSSTLERAGVPTLAGVVNALRQDVNERLDAAGRALSRRRRALLVAGRPGVPPELADRLERALDGLDEAERQPDPTVRARRRVQWARSAEVVGRRAPMAAEALAEATRVLDLFAGARGAPDVDALRATVRAAGWAAMRAAAAQDRGVAKERVAARNAAAQALRDGRVSPAEAMVHEDGRRRAELLAARERVALLDAAELDPDDHRARRARRAVAAAEVAVAEARAIMGAVAGMTSRDAEAAALRAVGAEAPLRSAPHPGPDVPQRRRRRHGLER